MVSAIISTYNRDRYLPDVLESLTQQSLEKDLFEIILVNNNSSDNTEKISKEFEASHPEINFRYFLETNQGLSYARNRGIKESKGDYLVFVDDDAFLCTDYLKEVHSYLKANPNVSGIGGKILLKFEGKRPNWANKYLDPLWGYYYPSDEIQFFKNNTYPIGCNMAMRADVFDQVGDFNVNLGRVGKNLAGGEEKDMFLRMYQKGMRVAYLPKAFVHHSIPVERTTVEFIKRQAEGIGLSERQRVSDEGGMAPFKRSLIEVFKWGASFLLYFFYLVQGKPAVGKMIVKFRSWVSKGYFKKGN
jgi:glycosyltransferase involved in cell wall biosynthesis